MNDLGPYGFALDISDDDHLADAGELERQGWSTLWIAGGQLGRPSVVTDVLAATSTAVIGTAVLSSEVHSTEDVVRLHAETERRFPGRAMFGLGGPQSGRSFSVIDGYLDRLDGSMPPADRMLAALGPRKLRLAAARTSGAITLLVTPDFVRSISPALGDATLVVDLPVVLDTDAASARRTARGMLSFLVGLPGYQRHLTRLGFGETDVAGLADRLVDELVAWGDTTRVADRVRELGAAGADHVFLTVLADDGQPTGVAAARLLADELKP